MKVKGGKKKSSKKSTFSVINNQFLPVFLNCFLHHQLQRVNSYINMDIVSLLYHMRTGILFVLSKLHLILSGLNPFLFSPPTIFTISLMYSHCQNLHVCNYSAGGITQGSSSLSTPAKQNKFRKVHTSRLSYGGTAENLGFVSA